MQISDHYPEDMNTSAHPPAIPAAALARQARLVAALQAMEALAPSLEPQVLQDLRGGILGQCPCDQAALLTRLAASDLLEEAGEMLRTCRRLAAEVQTWENFSAQLAPLVLKAQQRRSASWHLDSRRALIRLQYAKEGVALGFDDGDLHTIFLQAFRLEGLSLAMDLGKRPRPLLSVGLPLPAEVGGWAETMDAVLKREPPEDPLNLVARLNRRLPAGLRIEQWTPLPSYAAPVCELALLSHWRWEPSSEARSAAAGRVSAFLAAEVWPWDRGGAKTDAPLDLRRVVRNMRWEGDCLCFSTLMGAHHALNPLKVLMAILGSESMDRAGLVRTGVELKPDARLGQAERFEPKLKNMYEDAVLLGGGSNIILVDEDDDEPLRLGPD